MPTRRQFAIGLIAFAALMGTFVAGGPGNARVDLNPGCRNHLSSERPNKNCPPTTTTTTDPTTTTTTSTTTAIPATRTTTASSNVAVRIGNATIVEGNVGAHTVWFAVRLSAPSTSTVSVHYATVAGTAIPGSDFTGGSGTVTIPARAM